MRTVRRSLPILVLLALAGALPAPAEWDPLPDPLRPDGPVYGLTMWQGQLVAVGRFQRFDAVDTPNVAVFDGVTWNPVGGGVGWVDRQGWAEVALEYEGDLIVGGTYAGAGEDPETYFLARWDGEAWSDMGADLNGRVTALAEYRNDLIIGGTFTRAGGRDDIDRVARFNGTWRAMGQGFNLQPSSLFVHDGLLLAGGVFSTAGGAPASSIASWDGSDWVVVGAGFDADLLPSNVFDLLLWEGGLLATGHFTRSGPERLQGVARFQDGNWLPLSGGGLAIAGGEYWAFAAAEYQGSVYFGGNFTSAGGSLAQNLAVWDGVAWAPVGSGADRWVRDLLVHDGRLWIAGDFDRIGGLDQPYLTRWFVEPLSVEEGDPAPGPRSAGLDLRPNRPNPFNPRTELAYSVAAAGPVRLRILDPRGRAVRTLVDGPRAAGAHTVIWDGADDKGRPMPSGVYLVQLVADSQQRRGKITLVR